MNRAGTVPYVGVYQGDSSFKPVPPGENSGASGTGENQAGLTKGYVSQRKDSVRRDSVSDEEEAFSEVSCDQSSLTKSRADFACLEGYFFKKGVRTFAGDPLVDKTGRRASGKKDEPLKHLTIRDFLGDSKIKVHSATSSLQGVSRTLKTKPVERFHVNILMSEDVAQKTDATCGVPDPVVVTDEHLARDRGGRYVLWADWETLELFSDRGPLPGDVQQHENLPSCFLLGAAAAYTATPAGRRHLQSMLKWTSDRMMVNVRLYDQVTEKQVVVSVSPYQILDANRTGLYSFGQPGLPIWPAVLEKAVHACNLDRRVGLKTLIAEARLNHDLARVTEYEAKLASIIASERHGGRGQTALGLQYFGCSWKEARIPVPQTLFLEAVTTESQSTFIEALRNNHCQGMPITVGVDARLRHVTQSLRHGHAAGHVFGVMGFALYGNSSGWVLYDPHGERCGGSWIANQIVECPYDDPCLAKRGESVFFVQDKDIFDRFTHVGVTAGGPTVPLNGGAEKCSVSASPHVTQKASLSASLNRSLKSPLKPPGQPGEQQDQ